MMKKMNKKLLGSLILGLMLSAPVSQVNAIQLNGGGIYGASDSYGEYRIKDNGSFIYDFGGDSQLTITGDTVADPSKYGIYILRGQNPDVKKIKVADKLDISIIKHDSFGALGGIIVSSVSGRIVDRSEGGDITIESYNDITGSIGATFEGVSLTAGDNNTISIGDSNITLKAIDAKYGLSLNGLNVDNGSGNLIKMGDGAINITGTVASGISGYSQGIGIWAWGEGNTIETGDVPIKIDMTNSQNIYESVNAGIEADSDGIVNTGNGDIHVYGKGGEAVFSYGALVSAGGTITKADGNITAISEGEGTLAARTIFANGGNVKVGIANITAQTIGGGSADDGYWIESIGLLGWNKSVIDYAGGTITALADNEDAYVAAVHAQDAADIDINKDTNNTVVINGDVKNSGTGAIYLNLNTADSVLNGAVSDANGTFNLENGAQWNVLGASTVNDFQMKNGIINMVTGDDVDIKTYSGNGTISFLAEDTAADGVANFENVGDVTIKEAEKGSSVTLGIANNKIDTLDLEKTEENLNALAKKISYTGDEGNLTGKAVIKEGLITPEASGDLLFDNRDRGYVANMTRGSRMTKTMNAMKNLEAAAAIAWRQEDSTFSQRLGELRESTGGQGIWARMSRGEFEYDGEYKNQYNFFQLGYDWASDNWHYGVAVSHNDGETAYTYGSGENRSTSLSLYGTWLGDAGHYADIVLKQGRLSNDFDVYTSAGHTSGDYDAWGTSLSGEYGKKILLENDWYVTPQAQLTLMRIGGEDYDTNNGIRVRQDTLYSAVGRLGFELGRKLDEKGSVYAKASVLHDFAGNAETYLSYNGFTNSYSQDLSDTWFEAGLGFNYRTGDNSYIYADVVRTFGGDVETPWQWNIGMRWSC